MNAAAGGRALAARQIDQVQPAAAARTGVLPPAGRTAAETLAKTLAVGRLLREADGEQRVATTAAGILKSRGCLSGLRALLHV